MKTLLYSAIGSYVATGDTFAGADWGFITCAAIILLTVNFIYKVVYKVLFIKDAF